MTDYVLSADIGGAKAAAAVIGRPGSIDVLV
jgi:hypothetical protein